MNNKTIHPMDTNINTRMRWEVIRRTQFIKDLRKKKVLDIGCGLGYFSIQFSKLGADVLAIDIDKSSLKYLSQYVNIQTKFLDVDKEKLPAGSFDIVFIGEILEHITKPDILLNSVKNCLSPSGVIILTTPALEGIFIHTSGKRLGHEHGVERHVRDGFYLEELQQTFSKLRMDIVYHTFAIYTMAELFMQLTKKMYLRKRKIYKSQADILSEVGTFKYRIFRQLFSFLLPFFNLEQNICHELKINGHGHVVVAKKK